MRVNIPHRLIMASAGSGKTFQLVSRYISLLAVGAEPGKILAATFARKAAGEILDKIMLRLCEASLDADKARETAQEIGQHGFGVLIVNADAAFHRDLDRAGGDHCRDALRDQVRPGHQHGAKTARLHAVAGAAHVQIDLVIAPIGTDPRRLGQLRGFRAAQLQRQRMLGRVEIQQPGAVAMDDGGGGDHFCVKQRPARQEPVKAATGAVGPIHHGRNR